MSADFPAIIGFMTEKRSGFGEDSEPITRVLRGLEGDVVGVFDGMGGAGATLVPAENERKEDLRSMAYLASRVAREEVDKVLCQWGKEDLSGLRETLESSVVARLVKLSERSDGKGPEKRIRGTILALYPTTVALAVVQTSKSEHATRMVKTLWAGDSRIYCLDPALQVPLQVLTRDHTETGGGGDAALQRFASAAGLSLEMREFELPPEAAVIAMTDGCYGYMSNFQLMYLLISQMMRSRDESEWIERIKERISRVAGDDTSFSISFGSGGFARLRHSLELRLSQMEPLAFIVETSPPNPLIVPHNESAYFEVLDAVERRVATELAASAVKVSETTDAMSELPSDVSALPLPPPPVAEV
jgi:hypothetical protein